MDSILDSVGSLVGVGKSAAVGKENAKLKAENERMKKAFAEAVKDKAEERTKVLVAEKQEAEAERDRALVQSRSLAIERDKAVRQLQEQKDGERQRISQAVSQATAEKDKTIRLLQSTLKASRHILSLFADMLYKASEVFRRAIDAIIHFLQGKRGFQASHRCDYPFRHGAAQVILRPVRSRRHQERDAGVRGNNRTAKSGRSMALRLCGEPTAF